ncbi:LysR family transcriptional regulator [Variovorax sp. efr-133-TYG-130]|uniref:LysR family transcriptional regulator n=1 Tax=Variovorax sp. efr-133-TYG-130 TaxID=3040327 RepID=UPI0025572144|nr:LysR family transcriptional regulator [Variovorax sp. efr-133-TYG-130]
MSIHKASLYFLPSVRQLRAFVAVYQSGSVSAAARELSLTQPAVSVLLKELEERLGLRLFDRSTRILRRTEAASQVIDYAERALTELHAMAAATRRLTDVSEGRIRVAATAAVAQTLLPHALRQFEREHPGITIEIFEVTPSDFVEAVAAERVDFAVGTLEAPVPGLREDAVMHDVLVAAAGTSDGFPEGTSMTWRQLSALPIVTVRPGYGIRRKIEIAAAEAGVSLRIAHEVTLLGTAVALAASGLGVTVVPSSVVARTPGLAIRRLTRPIVERVISIVTKHERSLSPASEAFAKFLRRTSLEFATRHRGRR